MLGKNADAIFWLFRYIERSENLTVLLDNLFSIYLTNYDEKNTIYTNIIYLLAEKKGEIEDLKRKEICKIIDIFLRDEKKINSVPHLIKKARENALVARTYLTSDLWKSINEYWLFLFSIKKRKIKENDIPRIIMELKIKCSLIRGAFNGTLLRNEIFYFGSLGTYIERASNTARVITIDNNRSSRKMRNEHVLYNTNWEISLKLLQCYSSYIWINKGQVDALSVANFIIFDPRVPRSLYYCSCSIYENILKIISDRNKLNKSLQLAKKIKFNLSLNKKIDLDMINQTVNFYIENNNNLSLKIEEDFKFIKQ